VFIISARGTSYNDIVSILSVMIFSFSGGYLNSIIMALAPQKTSPKEQESAGTIMIFSLTLGLVLGTAGSFAFLPAVITSPSDTW